MYILSLSLYLLFKIKKSVLTEAQLQFPCLLPFGPDVFSSPETSKSKVIEWRKTGDNTDLQGLTRWWSTGGMSSLLLKGTSVVRSYFFPQHRMPNTDPLGIGLLTSNFYELSSSFYGCFQQ